MGLDMLSIYTACRRVRVDVPMPFTVRFEHRSRSWSEVFAFWSAPNLQVINKAAHLENCAGEAAEQARLSVALFDPIENKGQEPQS
jgi:hypothetical protein